MLHRNVLDGPEMSYSCIPRNGDKTMQQSQLCYGLHACFISREHEKPVFLPLTMVKPLNWTRDGCDPLFWSRR